MVVPKLCPAADLRTGEPLSVAGIFNIHGRADPVWYFIGIARRPALCFHRKSGRPDAV